MIQPLFKVKVSLAPCKEADDSEILPATLGNVLVSSKWRAKVEAVRAAKTEAEKAKLKAALPCFTPSGTFTHISNAGLIQHSGFICIDVDYKPERGENLALKDYDLKTWAAHIPHVAYCGHSCSGAGYFLIIPIADPAKHEAYFDALAYHFERAGLAVDRSCRNVGRLRFVSYDPAPYINTSAKTWTITLPATNPERPPRKPSPATAEQTATLKQITAAVEAGRWDIAPTEKIWWEMICALANVFGDAGRDYAQRLFQFYPYFDAEATDSRYTRALKHPEYNYTFATLTGFYNSYCRAHDFDGIDV